MQEGCPRGGEVGGRMGKLPVSPLPSHDEDTLLLTPDVWCRACQAGLWHQLGIPQYGSVLTPSTWDECQVPHVKGSVRQDSPISGGLQTPVVTCTSDGPAINSASQDSLLGSNNLWEWLTELREALAYIYQPIINNILKDTDDWPDEKTHMGASWAQEPLVPIGLGSPTLWACGCVHQPRSSSIFLE